MSTIKIKCVDQTLTLTNTPIIASGGAAEDYVQFDFCSLWNGYIKTAVFWRTPTEARTAVLDSNGKALIPQEILTTEGIIYIGAFGTNGKTRRTSEVVRYKVVKGAVSEDTSVPDPSADVWTQILSLCADILDKVDNAQEKLDSAASKLSAATTALNNAENKLAGSMIETEQYTDGSITAPKIAYGALVKIKSFSVENSAWTENSYGTYNTTVTISGIDPDKHIGFLMLQRSSMIPGVDTSWGFSPSMLDLDDEKMSCIFGCKITAANELTLTAKEAPYGTIYLRLAVIHI